MTTWVLALRLRKEKYFNDGEQLEFRCVSVFFLWVVDLVDAQKFFKKNWGEGILSLFLFHFFFFFCFLSGYKRDDITVGSVFLFCFCFPFGRVDKITETTNRFFLPSIENRKIFFFFFVGEKKNTFKWEDFFVFQHMPSTIHIYI